ncbi:MAG TPA: cupin domain-containing protein [Solirubrobacteraceae bacterium]
MSGLVRNSADAPERRLGNDATAVRDVIGEADGCELFTLRTLRTVVGHGIARETAADAQELLFSVSGGGRLITPDGEHELDAEAGVLVPSGHFYELVNEGPADLVVVAVSLHSPEGSLERTTVSRLSDRPAQSATAAREFRIVFDPGNGCASATQFVGYIPVGAAPAHYHLYDEVIYVLDGVGVMHMGGERTPLHAGSCIHLPAREVHTLANSGPGEMRVLGVFRPAGSPAAAFYPDGTPAMVAGEPEAQPVS